MPIIGAHVSVAGGLAAGIDHAKHIGAEAIQIFGSSPRQWQTAFPSKENVLAYKKALSGSDVQAVYLHAAYLANPAGEKPDLWQKSIQSLADHLKIVEMIGADGLIFHTGSGNIRRVSQAIREVLKLIPGKSRLLIENSSGGGQKVGTTIDQLAEIFHAVDSGRVKFCLDTAHAFEAGVLEYTPEKIESFFDEWDAKVGLENLVALHANDSKTKFGSHSDRHENIGEGYIGMEGFKNLAKEKRLHDKVWLLEVPGFDDLGPDKRNVDILTSLF